MKNILLFSALVMNAIAANAQLTITNGNHTLEISGSVSTFYNYRAMKDGEVDMSKNRFKLRDAQIGIDGRIGSDFEYTIKADFADMAANNGTTVIDPENPGLLEANVTYKGLKYFDIQAGYGKLYYSRDALVPFQYSPYWQSPEITRGSLFSTRDVGVTLIKNFWKQRANAYLGAYTGLGELSLVGDNDPSGQLEYVGRFDISYPSRYRYHVIDDRHTPVPMFSLGVAGRYANKRLPDGTAFPANATAAYGTKVIDGKRYIYGLDASFQYMGFSAQFEMHQMRMEPQHANDPLYLNYTSDQTKGHIFAGGYIVQANYFSTKLKTIFSARYETLDLNDLNNGNSERFSGAIAYQIKGYNAMVKFQYFNILKEESIDPFTWKQQYRLGLQFELK